MSTIAQQQQTFNAFTKQQEKLLEQQEMLVSGMKKIQKKKIRKFHETYSPTTSSSSNQLSPVDIGPLVDSICAPLEKEVKKQEEQLHQLSEYRKAQLRRSREEEEYGLSIPSVKSGTIAGMLDDFNKQMEQLKVREAAAKREEEKLLRSREEAKKKEEKGRRYSLDSKMVSEHSPPRTKIENKKLPTVSETDRLSSEIERNQNAIIKLLNARNNQALLPSVSETVAAPTSTTASGSKSTLAVQPIKKTLEKIVSPMIDKTIDKTMHQQQLLITQQQQLIALQKEQNKLQQQLQGKLLMTRSIQSATASNLIYPNPNTCFLPPPSAEQLKKQQETQIAREAKLEKEQRLLELQKQQQSQLLELEHQEMKLKQEKQFQIQQEAIKREAVKKQLQSHQQLQGTEQI